MVIFRESNLNIYLFTNLDTYQLIFKSRDKASGTNSQVLVFCFAAVERNAVNRTVKI